MLTTNQIRKKLSRSTRRNQVLSFLLISIIAASCTVLIPSIAWTFNTPGQVLISQKKSVQDKNSSKANEVEIKNLLSSYLLSIAGTGVIPKISQVIILNNYAMADWQLGEGGGTALLTKQVGSWQLITLGGGLLNSGGMQGYGVPENTAKELERLRLACITSSANCKSN